MIAEDYGPWGPDYAELRNHFSSNRFRQFLGNAMRLGAVSAALMFWLWFHCEVAGPRRGGHACKYWQAWLVGT